MIFEGKVNVTINFVPEDIFVEFELIKRTKSINPNNVIMKIILRKIMHQYNYNMTFHFLDGKGVCKR